MMKMTLKTILTLIFLLCLLFSCNNEVDATANIADKTESETSGAAEVSSPVDGSGIISEGYCFMTRDVRIDIGDDLKSTIEELGEYINMTETPSCAFEGSDFCYYYYGFQLNAHGNDVDNAVIYSIYISDDSVESVEGAYVGMSTDEIHSIYGDYDALEGESTYIYYKGDTKLSIICSDGIVLAIVYSSNAFDG